MHIRKDDIVEVITGDDAGTRGKALRVDRVAGRILVEGINRVRKHVRKSQKNPQGGILSKEAAISLSNVMLVCQACNRAARTGTRLLDGGGKERFCKRCGAGSARSEWPRPAARRPEAPKRRPAIVSSRLEDTDLKIAMTPRLQERYQKEVLPALGKQLGRDNRHSLPRLEKIVINMGVGSAISEKKHLEEAVEALTQIAGQKPVVTLARQSIAGFKLRQGMPIGCMVTLRGQRMYEFLDRLISLALPRVRDFRGLSPNAFDGNGNYNLGLSEQLVFPELNPDKYTRPQGMNITIVTSATRDDDARHLLRGLGMPLRSEQQEADTRGKK